MTAMLTVTTAVVMAVSLSETLAVGCLIGGGLMIGNLYILNLIGRAVLAIARDYGGATGAGVAAIPLKMFLVIGIVYVIITSGRVDVPGFIVGILTQFVAILIETWRVSKWGGATPPEGERA